MAIITVGIYEIDTKVIIQENRYVFHNIITNDGVRVRWLGLPVHSLLMYILKEL